MYVHDGKQLVATSHGNHVSVIAYDTYTGMEETVICTKSTERSSCGVTFICNTKSGTVYVAVSYPDAGVVKLEFWPYKSNIENRHPVYTCEHYTSFPIGSFEKHVVTL